MIKTGHKEPSRMFSSCCLLPVAFCLSIIFWSGFMVLRQSGLLLQQGAFSCLPQAGKHQNRQMLSCLHQPADDFTW